MDVVESEIRTILARVLDRDPALVAELPAGTELFGPELNLTSLAGARLLAGVQDRFGVDVAAEDWALESLTSIGTLADFVRGAVG